MAVIIINPNSTCSMTDAMLAQARRAAPELVFEGWTSHDAPLLFKVQLMAKLRVRDCLS